MSGGWGAGRGAEMGWGRAVQSKGGDRGLYKHI